MDRSGLLYRRRRFGNRLFGSRNGDWGSGDSSNRRGRSRLGSALGFILDGCDKVLGDDQ
jgi:hypothetical protein